MPKDLTSTVKTAALNAEPYRKAKSVDLKNADRPIVLSVLLTLTKEEKAEYLSRFVRKSNQSVENALLSFVPWLFNRPEVNCYIEKPSHLTKAGVSDRFEPFDKVLLAEPMRQAIAAIVACLEEKGQAVDRSDLPDPPTYGPYYMRPSSTTFRYPLVSRKSSSTGLLIFPKEGNKVEEHMIEDYEPDEADDADEAHHAHGYQYLDDIADVDDGEPNDMTSEPDDMSDATLAALTRAIKRIQAYTSLKNILIHTKLRQLLRGSATDLARRIFDLLDSEQAAWWQVLLECQSRPFDSNAYRDWVAKHGFVQGDQHHTYGGLYLWIDGERTYGGQSKNIKERWDRHWNQASSGQRFYRECSVKDGRVGIMMRDGGDPVLRSVGEAMMILALGLGKGNGSGRWTRQKQTLEATGGVRLHDLAMNDAVGWETISGSRGVVKVKPSRFPTFYPPLLIGDIDATSLSSEAKTRRGEAANAGVKAIARYQGLVSMEATQSLTIAGRSSRAGSYKYLEVSGWGLIFRITSKFLPRLWDLVSDENARVRCHVDFEYLVPMQEKSPEVWVRENWDSDGLRFNIVLSDILLGRSFIEPVRWEDLKAYKKEVEENEPDGDKVEVEMLSTGYQIWAKQIPGEWSEKILNHQMGTERKALIEAGAIERP